MSVITPKTDSIVALLQAMDKTIPDTVRLIGDKVGISSVFVDAIFSHNLIKQVDAAIVLLAKQSVVITFPVGVDMEKVTVADALIFKENKALEILLYFGIRVASRGDVFRVLTATRPSDVEAKSNSGRTEILITVTLLSVFLHGHLQRLKSSLGNAVSIASKAFAGVLDKCQQSDFTNEVSLWNIKLDNVVKATFISIPSLPDSLKNRFELGMAGQRVVSIMGCLASLKVNLTVLPECLRFLAHEDVQADRPFVTLHPLSKFNPFAGSVSKIYALVGHAITSSKMSIEDVASGSKGLFADYIIAAMKVDHRLATGKVPTMKTIVEAIRPRSSVARRVRGGSTHDLQDKSYYLQAIMDVGVDVNVLRLA